MVRLSNLLTIALYLESYDIDEHIKWGPILGCKSWRRERDTKTTREKKEGTQ